MFNNFVAVLSNDRINLHDRNKLNSVLSGLVHCLSLVAKATENDNASDRQVCTMNSSNSFLTKVFIFWSCDEELGKIETVLVMECIATLKPILIILHG